MGYFSEDTIAAVASAVGGALTVVRISGKSAFPALRSLLPPSRAAEEFPPRALKRAALITPEGAALDDALAVRFVSPESFTGEDVVELHLHGSPFVATRVLETLAHLGVRQALPGEFSFRAVRNGKMTLTQAEAVADLIAASNDGAVALALEKMSGTQNRLIASLAEGLRTLAVLGEAGIDFADQDIDEVSLPRLKSRLEPLIEDLRRLHSSYDRGLRVQDGVRVAFVGLPNAGKSSFFNALLGEERSIVSEIAGTTRDVVREHLTLRARTGSVTLRLEDTAGLRPTQDRVEQMGIERTRKAAQHADLILLIVDVTADVAAVQEQWRELQSPASKTLGVLTKCDLADPGRLALAKSALSALGLPVWIETSAQTGAGLAAAADQIVAYCERWVSRGQGEVLLTRIDHVQAVSRTLEHLQRAQIAAESDLFAADLRQALHSLGPLIGETLPDDILGQIFSNFCIGK